MKPRSAKKEYRKYKHSKTPHEYLSQRTEVKDNGCIEWVGPADMNGYGQCHSANVAIELGVTRAHQLAFVAKNGPVPEGCIVCHTCDNPRCCNPDHLYAGTWKSNVMDCVERGRHNNGSVRRYKDEEVLALYGKVSSIEAEKILGISYSRICQIWREYGKRGRNF